MFSVIEIDSIGRSKEEIMNLQDAHEYAEMAHEAARNGVTDIAFAVKQMFYDMTRHQEDRAEIVAAFRTRIRQLEKENPIPVA